MKLNLSAEYDGVKYRMDFIGEGPFTNTNVDMKEMFTARLFKILQGRMDLKLFGRNYFNPEKAKDQSGLRIWPGYKINFKRFNSKFYLNIDTVSKVLRKDTVLDIINGVRNQQTTNWESKVRDELIGESIITHYNRQIYRIDDITFEKTPGSTFSLGTKGDEKTYETYYREKYNITIKELNQPLLITRPKKGRIKEIMLIPELCLMTGLTEKQRSDRTLMNQLNDLIKPNCNTRMSNSAEFIKFMK
jgi:aubergine-like protein